MPMNEKKLAIEDFIYYGLIIGIPVFVIVTIIIEIVKRSVLR